MLQIEELNRMGVKKVVEVGISETMAYNVDQNYAFQRKKNWKKIEKILISRISIDNKHTNNIWGFIYGCNFQ